MIKAKFTDLKQKMKGMSFREGFDYLWTYYRLPVFAAAFCTVCLISLLSGVVKSRLSDPVVRVAVNDLMDLAYGDDISELLEAAFPDSAGFTSPEKMSVSSPKDHSNPYSSVQLTAYLSANTFDALLCDQDTLNFVSESTTEFEAVDISKTELGIKAESLGITPFYYVIMTDTEHEQQARIFLDRIQSKTQD